ncbi:CatB-related O-acetyltransferase [Dongshaea marina]|uniref:CatB-related O-acetyltransferase n=1 Tax=Dongshaea marina TaxID=2047966 RepID=UPI000D3E083F|nr:CatB-related O-acetyltransferase [Dongshaea marina]
MKNLCPHWSRFEYLHQGVTNPNIILQGTHSYFSGYYDGRFEDVAVRYLHGDRYSRDPQTGWKPKWPIDKLYIGDYVQIAAGVIILMGGNHTHNQEFISTYPFLKPEALERSYESRGDTRIGNDVLIGTQALLMPGVSIGDGAIIAARAVVTRNVAPYTLVAGTPAKEIRKRFSESDIAKLQQLQWWNWPQEKIEQLLPFIQQACVSELEKAHLAYEKSATKRSR